MIDTLWVDVRYRFVRLGKNVAEFFEKIRVNLNLFGGAIRSDEDILHDAGGSRDIDRYCFSDSRHIALSVNILCNASGGHYSFPSLTVST